MITGWNGNSLKGRYFIGLSLAFVGLASGLQGQNLRIGAVTNDCPSFVEVPVTWVQPDTSNVTTMTFEFTYSPTAFQETFIGTNDPSNRPLVLRGAQLQAGSFNIISQQAQSGGSSVPGRWFVSIISTGSMPFPNIPNGEILRLRFFPNPGTSLGVYDVAVQPGSAAFFSSTGTAVPGVTTANGSITLLQCATTTTTTSPPTTTTTTAPPTTTTTAPPTTTTSPPTTTTTAPPTTTTTSPPPTTTTTVPATTTTSSTTTTSTTTSTTTTTAGATTTTLPPALGPAAVLEYPQIAVGGGYRAFLIIENPNDFAAQAAVGFRNEFGLPLTLRINGVTSSSAAFNIPAQGSIKLTLDDPGLQIKTGWCQVFANRPIGGLLVYQFLNGTMLVAEGSVLPAPRIRRFSLLVSQLGNLTDTGLAMANPDDSPALIVLRRLTSDGLVVAETSFSLGPGEQIARFISQFFPAGFALLEGRVEVTSTRGIVAVGLIFQGEIFTTASVLPLP